VVIDRQEGHWFIGRSEFDSPEVDNEVLITPAPGQTLRIGEFYSIRITDATEYDLMGEV
jgi:ribosomal protein S12 methylthiotransferase